GRLPGETAAGTPLPPRGVRRGPRIGGRTPGVLQSPRRRREEADRRGRIQGRPGVGRADPCRVDPAHEPAHEFGRSVEQVTGLLGAVWLRRSAVNSRHFCFFASGPSGAVTGSFFRSRYFFSISFLLFAST